MAVYVFLSANLIWDEEEEEEKKEATRAVGPATIVEMRERVKVIRDR